MTDKEQIIIDGVYINTCLVSEKCKEFETCNIKNILRQLARKAQECEERKEENDRYRKALEEIEEVIKTPCAEDCVYYELSRCYDCIKTSILDIINKAKGK